MPDYFDDENWQARDYWRALPAAKRDAFRFLHVSTDEVYGTLGETGKFSETTAYAPNSPYSASKAASDHLVRAFHHTYGLPVLTTNCSNNYGPYHFPEKLIPLVIAKALAMHGGGRLHSYDGHAPFVTAMQGWLAEHDLEADFHHAPLVQRDVRWPGLWYGLTEVPGSIDLLVIDGPPWAVHPFARGMAERLFALIAPGGTVLLDDAARPGERYVARRWKKAWPDFEWRYESAGTKGLLVGRRRA